MIDERECTHDKHGRSMKIYDFITQRTQQEKDLEFLRLMEAIKLILSRLGKGADGNR